MIPAADPKRLPPDGLKLRGRRVWNAVTELHDDGTPKYVLRPDELMALENWARAADKIADIEVNIARWAGQDPDAPDYYMPGIGGSTVANPLLSELRQWMARAEAAAKALKLPDLEVDGVTAKTQAEHQSAAAHARWSKKPATG